MVQWSGLKNVIYQRQIALDSVDAMFSTLNFVLFFIIWIEIDFIEFNSYTFCNFIQVILNLVMVRSFVIFLQIDWSCIHNRAIERLSQSKVKAAFTSESIINKMQEKKNRHMIDERLSINHG